MHTAAPLTIAPLCSFFASTNVFVMLRVNLVMLVCEPELPENHAPLGCCGRRIQHYLGHSALIIDRQRVTGPSWYLFDPSLSLRPRLAL